MQTYLVLAYEAHTFAFPINKDHMVNEHWLPSWVIHSQVNETPSTLEALNLDDQSFYAISDFDIP